MTKTLTNNKYRIQLLFLLYSIHYDTATGSNTGYFCQLCINTETEISLASCIRKHAGSVISRHLTAHAVTRDGGTNLLPTCTTKQNGFVIFFNLGLFNDASCSSDYTVSITGLISE
jgi:hypothetical protein